jgi:ABC-type Fe3+ transport system permease subunit
MNFAKWMQAASFAVLVLMTSGLLIGVGWLYKTGQVDKSDAILIYVLGQFITNLMQLIGKINRYLPSGVKDDVKGE